MQTMITTWNHQRVRYVVLIMVLALAPTLCRASCFLPITCPAVPIDYKNFVDCNSVAYANNAERRSNAYAAFQGGLNDASNVVECVPVNPGRGERTSNGRTQQGFLCADTHKWKVLYWIRNSDVPVQQTDSTVKVKLFDLVEVEVQVKGKQFCNVYTPFVDPNSEKTDNSGDCGPQAVSINDDCRI